MRKIKKFLSMLLALVMVLGVTAPVMAAETTPHKTIIRIHKIVMPKTDMDAHKD